MARALISVSDKTGIVELGKALVRAGIEIVSTGGTYKALSQAGVAVTEVSAITGFPEMMDGRVKTLHPMIHGGLLALRDETSHMQAIKEHGIGLIDFVIVNLYPFAKTIANPDVVLEEAIENIDIGGPSMLRAAAKNYRFVVTAVDPADYPMIIAKLDNKEPFSEEERFLLCAKVFRHTAKYDAIIADYLTKKTGAAYPEDLTVAFTKVQGLRYGENPHQTAAFYQSHFAETPSLVDATQVQGKELSYNNIQDAGAAIDLITEFDQPTVVALKHMNPCGVGTGDSIFEAWERAYAADPISIFGGIVASNREVTEEMAQALTELFLEIVIAPSFTEGALERLSKKKNVRVLLLPSLNREVMRRFAMKSVTGGFLVQDADAKTIGVEDLKVVTKRKPTEQEVNELLFAWRVVKHVKSNAIVLTKEGQTIGVGAGQMNRVGAAKIAIEQAGDLSRGSVMASDAFFPMPDTVEEAVKAGVTAIIQPGGSIKDQASIDVADEHGIAMVFTGVRHFKH